MKYKYKARNQAGVLQEGMVEASTTASASALLQRHNLIVVSLEPQKEKNPLESLSRIWEGVSGKEFVIFSRQMAVMVEAKVPLLSALQGIIEQTENPYFAGILSAVLADVDEGKSFSEALRRHPEVFSDLYINMVQSGEVSGNLQQSLENLADNIEKKLYLDPEDQRSALLSRLHPLGFFSGGISDDHFRHPEAHGNAQGDERQIADHDASAHLDGQFHAALLVGGADRHHCRGLGSYLLYKNG